MKVNILESARRVLKIESEAVRRQIRHIGPDFARVVDRVEQVTRRGGQVVVMGIGKSGLIGRKIAATLSSTGTPAVFFHPAEGLHGDLGMIRAGDCMLILSASGETDEIRKILPVLKERKLILIAMTGQKNSRLARSADLTIDCSVEQEACPLNLTPTASTTAMIALGDALAVSLMEKRGFRPADFARLHPGGALGKQLFMTVGELMRKGKENPVVKLGCTVRQALLEMTRTRLGATHVVARNGKLAGFFTDGDLRRHLQSDPQLLSRAIEKVMTRNPRVVTPDQSVYVALNLIKSFGIDNIPVVDKKGRPVGILDERDILAEGIA